MQYETILGHPRGLFILFFTEMWERFSYYGMRALLIFYLTKHFLFDQNAAYGIYGAYTTLVYITPVIGGILADRYLGQFKAIFFGAILLVLGHLGMAIEGDPVAPGSTVDGGVLNMFYLSLALIIMGVGFLKANISTIVGELYEKTDIRRDSAYTIFYVGINLGAFLGALISGYLGETYGWSYGFGAAGVGMLLGLVVFYFGRAELQGAGEPPKPELLKQKFFAGLNVEHGIYLASLSLTVVIWFLVRDQGSVNMLLIGFSAATLMYILWTSLKILDREQRQRIIAALILISVQVLFWALFEQAGSTLNIFADEQVDRTILGWEVPASMFQSLNAFYIIVFGPLFALMWVGLAKRNLDPSTPVKFALGVAQLGLGFLVLAWGASVDGSLTPVVFIFLLYLLHTTGELCLSPVGLSTMTRLSVARMVGIMMGTWFLASAAGNSVAALIAQATIGDSGKIVEVYNSVGWMAMGAAVLLLLLAPLIKRLMHTDTL